MAERVSMGLGINFLLPDGLADRYGGISERRVGVAAGGHPVERLVVGGVLMELGRDVAQRILRVDDGGQRLVVNLDQLQRVLGLVAVLRHHHGHSVAYVAHHAGCNGGIRDGFQVGVGDGPGAGYRVEHAFNVCARVHGQHAGCAFGRVGVYAADASMSMRAAQDGGVYHAGELDVVGVRGLAGDQARVLAPPDAGTENTGSHSGLQPPCWAAAAARAALTMLL